MVTASRIIDWIKSAELPSGGLAGYWNATNKAWSVAYPEITGYTIPTLIDYGEFDLAQRLADWLLTVQREDGAFLGMDLLAHTFDTAACGEGLKAAYTFNMDERYLDAAEKAFAWVRSMERDDGALMIGDYSDGTRPITARAAALADIESATLYWADRPGTTWPDRWPDEMRPHYIAYCLEGLDYIGEYVFVRRVLEAAETIILPDGMMPLYVKRGWQDVRGTCSTATAQFGVLFCKYDLDYSPLRVALELIVGKDGACRQTLDHEMYTVWTAKFILDFLRCIDEE
ncbi:MAG: terpene cyclase/mutase family protein [Gammaproteobacteria bacterium]|nr:terpene cyclase/mutase family protein [Gammaproteobacteria bacterium]